MQTDTHRYHVAQRESYSVVRTHYYSNTRGKRKSVIGGGDNNKNVKVLPEDYATEAEARAAAEAEFARTQRSQATFSYLIYDVLPRAKPILKTSGGAKRHPTTQTKCHSAPPASIRRSGLDTSRGGVLPAAARLLARLEGFTGYLENNRNFIVNYGDRCRHGELNTSSFVESAVTGWSASAL